MKINEDVCLIPNWAGWVPRYWGLCIFHYWKAFTLTDVQNLDFSVILSKLKKTAEAEYPISIIRPKNNNPNLVNRTKCSLCLCGVLVSAFLKEL